MRTITKARWIPDLPTPDGIDQMMEDTGMKELIPIEYIPMVSVREKKRVDWEKACIIGTAVTPITATLIMHDMLIQTPLAFAAMGVGSIIWNMLIMWANIKRTRPRARGRVEKQR